jgi:hypothetical protein
VTVEYTSEDGVGVVILNRPPANSYDRAFIESLGDALDQAGADGSVRAVVVRSGIDKFFCAGADVKAFGENDADTNMALVRRAHEVFNAIAAMRQVVVADDGWTVTTKDGRLSAQFEHTLAMTRHGPEILRASRRSQPTCLVA